MRLFLDSSTYLGFYELSKDNLEELRKLAVMVKNRQTVLYLPEQVRVEFDRQRESVIARALKALESAKLPTAFPQLVRSSPAYADLREALKTYSGYLAQLGEQARHDAVKRELHADRIVKILFLRAKKIPTTPELWEAARHRVDLGNPPGKGGSHGDAVNWEALLQAVPQGEDMMIATGDSD